MPVPEGRYSVRLLPREDGGSSGLSTNTIIIIAVVCGCVVILALSLFMWRLLRRCCSKQNSAPLPPVQDLAHHRRAVLAEHYSVSSRPATWLDPSAESLAPIPRVPSYQTNSSALSLLREKNPSVYTDELGTAESSQSSPVNLAEPVKLYPPNPVFNGSTESGGYSPAASQNSLPSASPSPVPFSEESSGVSHDTGSPDSHAMARPQSSLSRPHSYRSRSQVHAARRMSQISSATGHTTQTRRSTSTLRGAPHLTNMQIVLPAPLGPQPTYSGQSSTAHHLNRKSSAGGFADQWINSTTSGDAQTTMPAPVPERPTEVHRKLSKRSNSRTRSRSVQPAPSSHSPPSRSSSRPSPSRHNRSTSSLRHEVSHAREEPSQYSSLADLAESAYESDHRGRSRTSSRASALSFEPSTPPPMPRP